MKLALLLPNLGEPGALVGIGVAAERAGWDGVFLWDHVLGVPSFPVEMVDPWVVLGALAVRTERVVVGTMVTPLARRRPEKVARETVTVDRLSNGRMVLSVGLGSPAGEYTAFGDSTPPRGLAHRLDEALEVLAGLWSAEPYDHAGDAYVVKGAQFLPPPIQTPRIPVWVACDLGHRLPLARAARWDGLVLADPTEAGVGPVSTGQARGVLERVRRLRGDLDRFEVVVLCPGLPDQAQLDAYCEAGVTWIVVSAWLDQVAEFARRDPKGLPPS